MGKSNREIEGGGIAMSEITREEFNAFRTDMTNRFDRMDDKLDENIKCQYLKVPRDECSEHRRSVWARLDSLSKKVYIGVGVLAVLQVFVVPIVLWLIMR